MKITVKEKHTRISFYDTNCGIVFEWKTGYYIKTDDYTAVNLATGSILPLNSDDMIIPVTAELIITKE